MKLVTTIGVVIFFVSGCMLWIAMDLQVGGITSPILSRVILSILSKFLLLSIVLIAIPITIKLVKLPSEQPNTTSVDDFSNNPFKEHLDLNEMILWLGKPSPLGLASTGLQSVLLYWGLPTAMTFVVLGYYTKAATPSVKMALSCLFIISAIIFCGLCYIAIRGWFHETHQNQYYAITNQRLWLAVSKNSNAAVFSCLDIQDVDTGSIKVRVNSRTGVGTVICRSCVSGKEICFEYIDDADKVTAIINIAYDEYHTFMDTVKQ